VIGYAGVLTTSITLTAESFVSIAGNLGGKNVSFGSLYHFVTQNNAGVITVIGQITAQSFAPNFAYTVTLPAATYSVGTADRPSGSIINVYVVDAAGRADDPSAIDITSTLSAIVAVGAGGPSGARGPGVRHL
jgi:hypothetical protein